MSRTLLLVSLAALAIPVLARAQEAPTAQDAAQAEPKVERTWRAELGKLAPDFTLTDSQGQEFTLSAQRGKVVVLEWFNPGCPVVQDAHAAGHSLATLGNESRTRGVVWVAVNSGAPGAQGTGAEENEKARARMGLDYPVLLDESGWVGRMYEANNTPTMFVIDAAGRLAYAGAHQDDSGASLVAPALADLAAGRAVATPRTKAFGCGVKYEAKAKLGQVAPDFTLKDFAGGEHRLSDLRGKLVVLEWFNPGCPVVKAAHEGGALQGAAARATAQGVAWLAVNSGAPGKQGATREENTSAAARWKLTHPILADPDGKVGRAYDAKTTPQMVVLDERGVIVYAGAHQDQGGATHFVDQALTELRAGKPVSVPQTRSFGCGVKYAN